MAGKIVVRDLTFERAWALCHRFEEANGLSSSDFVARYRRGLVEATPAAMRWASTYEILLQLAPAADEIDETDLLIPA